MKKILFFIITLCFMCCVHSNQNSADKSNQEYQQFLDSLEVELQKLKNQAFCDCFNQALKNANAEITVPDGSHYIQISDLDINYFNNKDLRRIIGIWTEKEYHAYNEEDKLYLMQCLDFYNSRDLELYIDSVRQVEKVNWELKNNKK